MLPALRRVTAGLEHCVAQPAQLHEPPWATLSHTPRLLLSACQGKDLKRFALPWWLTPSCARSSPQFSLALHHWSFIRLMSWGWTDRWPPSQGQVHSLWRQETTVWGKGEEGEGGGSFNIKHYKTKKKLPFSQEHLQTLLHQGKGTKPQRSLFTKRPWLLSRQVPMPLICLCESRRCSLHPANLALNSPRNGKSMEIAAPTMYGCVGTSWDETSSPGTDTAPVCVCWSHSDSTSSCKAAHKPVPQCTSLVCPFLRSPNNTAEPLFLLKGALNPP